MTYQPDPELTAYIATMTPKSEGDYWSYGGPWSYSHKHPFMDFTREVVKPGVTEDFPEGALGIRADDDFWVVAVLPYRFAHLDIGTLVATLWPDIKDPTLNPDTDVPYDRRY